MKILLFYAVKTYTDFLEKLIEIINTEPWRTARKDNISNEWFDRETSEKLSVRDKLFQSSESSWLNIVWENYKGARNEIQRLMKHKKLNVLPKN